MYKYQSNIQCDITKGVTKQQFATVCKYIIHTTNIKRIKYEVWILMCHIFIGIFPLNLRNILKLFQF